MARMKFVQYRKAMSIVLLLFAATPPVLAQGLAAAQDILMEQLQTRTKEAEARAAEAEKREREAEINRLTDQAQQAQSHADAEAQRSLAVQRELSIQQAKTELHNSAYSRLEILIGVFGALITTLVVFFAWNTKETAIAAAKAGVEDIRGKLEARLMEAEALLEKIRKHQTDADKILKDLGPGEVPKSEADRKTIADAARVALAKPLKDRSANDYRTILTNYHAEEQWSDMLRTAQQMQLLHEAGEDFAFGRICEAYALGQLNRSEEEIAVYDDVVARFGAAPEAVLRVLVAIARVNKGAALYALNRFEEAIAVFEDVIAHYSAAPDAGLREQVAKAHVNKGAAFIRLDRLEEAISVYDDVILGYGASTEAGLRAQVAVAFYNRACAYAKMGRVAETITALQDMTKAGRPLNLKEIADETDFDPIRNDPDFKKFLDENKGA